MQRIEHVGTVVDVDGASAVVELRPTDQCGAGGLKCACCGTAASGPRQVRVRSEGLEQGDLVRLSVAAGAGYISILVIFVLPLVLMVIGGVLGAAVAGDRMGQELPIILGGLCGFAAGVGVSVVVNRRMAAAGCIEVCRLGGRSG